MTQHAQPERPYRYLRDTSESMWSHTINSTISRIDTKANTLELIADGHRKDTTLEEQAADLRHISDELRIQIRELFVELGRLQNASSHPAPAAREPTEYYITHDINCEYSSTITVTSHEKPEKIDEQTVKVGGITIFFDSDIESIETMDDIERRINNGVQ